MNSGSTERLKCRVRQTTMEDNISAHGLPTSFNEIETLFKTTTKNTPHDPNLMFRPSIDDDIDRFLIASNRYGPSYGRINRTHNRRMHSRRGGNTNLRTTISKIQDTLNSLDTHTSSIDSATTDMTITVDCLDEEVITLKELMTQGHASIIKTLNRLTINLSSIYSDISDIKSILGNK